MLPSRSLLYCLLFNFHAFIGITNGRFRVPERTTLSLCSCVLEVFPFLLRCSQGKSNSEFLIFSSLIVSFCSVSLASAGCF